MSAPGDLCGSDQYASGEVSGFTAELCETFQIAGLLRRIDIEPLTNDERPPTAILDLLDPPKDQLRIGLANGKSSHIRYYRPGNRAG